MERPSAKTNQISVGRYARLRARVHACLSTCVRVSVGASERVSVRACGVCVDPKGWNSQQHKHTQTLHGDIVKVLRRVIPDATPPPLVLIGQYANVSVFVVVCVLLLVSMCQPLPPSLPPSLS